jgi:microcompartment protein CcmL/EutN
MVDSKKSLGVLEYRSIATGMKAADDVLKTADVDLVFAKPVCPGKYVVLIKGDLSAVTAAMERGTSQEHEATLVDQCTLGNPHPAIFEGLNCSGDINNIEAIGIMETYSVASIFEVADDIVKTTPVTILEIRIAKGISGKAYVVFSGELSSVQASIEKAKKSVIEKGLLLQTSVIPRPDPRLWQEFV